VPRYKLTIAYDGTEFAGWQKQEPPVPSGEPEPPPPDHVRHPDPLAVTRPELVDPTLEAPEGRVALRTVQAVVERAVREVVREPVSIRGASRTDSGVHAKGQVAAFSCSGRNDEGTEAEHHQAEVARGAGWPIERGVDRLVRALNGRLPEDVLVVDAEVVRDDFDPIGDCVSKGYAYRLHVSPTRPLWERRYVQQVWQPVDVERMNEAASRIVGEHDFAAFAAAGHGRSSTVRVVFACEVKREAKKSADEWVGPVRIEVSGNGFLYNMVRIIAGTLVEVGRGKMSVDDVRRALENGDRRLAGPTMPAQGLCLEWIEYGASAEEPTAGRQSAKDETQGTADSASWFESYSNLLDTFSAHLPTGEGPFACPCCRKVTLTERGGYEICSECGWEDDGQDDPYADLITGGPNGRLSLTQAREQYQKRQHRLKRRPHPPDHPDTTA